MQSNIPHRGPSNVAARARALRANRRFINITLGAAVVFITVLVYVNVRFFRAPKAPRGEVGVVEAERGDNEAAAAAVPAAPSVVKEHIPPVTMNNVARAAAAAVKETAEKEKEGSGSKSRNRLGSKVQGGGGSAAPGSGSESQKKSGMLDSHQIKIGGVNNNNRRPIGEAEVKSGDEEDSEGALLKEGEDKEEIEEANLIPKDSNSDKKTLNFNRMGFEEAVKLYYTSLTASLKPNENPKQNTKSFVDINELEDDGIVLPHDPSQPVDPATYEACDNRNADFTPQRDALCQTYMSNVNNMHSIKALGSLLYSGRTIKFKVFYRHNGLQGVVKVSQQKFFFEAASEYLAYSVDRSLNFSYVPPTAFVAMPLDYMRAAAAAVGPFFSQWFEGFVPEYKYTQGNFVACAQGDAYAAFLDRTRSSASSGLPSFRDASKPIKGYETKCSQVAVQLWMKDVHSALDTFLAVPHEYSDKFAKKYMRPFVMKNETHLNKKQRYTWPPSRPYRQQAIGDLCDRFIFDFIIGNTDRGMNDHNNFAYGGCDEDTECRQPEPENRLKSKPKYAFIDHGSSFYSHKEPEGSPFTGNGTQICRFRRSTYDKLWYFHRENDKGYAALGGEHSRPFVHYTRGRLPKGLFNVIHMSVFKKTQDRLQKVVDIIDDCVDLFGESEVFSLTE